MSPSASDRSPFTATTLRKPLTEPSGVRRDMAPSKKVTRTKEERIANSMAKKKRKEERRLQRKKDKAKASGGPGGRGGHPRNRVESAAVRPGHRIRNLSTRNGVKKADNASDSPYDQLFKRAERGYDSSLDDGKGCWLYLKPTVELRKSGAFTLGDVIDSDVHRHGN
ncbi:uncharacterized protein N7515_005159 [Penicillium bovifimosum]|uniref:Uncharacterized protein n=1 Tax=Penicillium bovifimosum TaxID=126998 RepID=A0A9W9H1G2_9EURO|nr:uncharacterized protein N7515_005159 [Penicillium bovifimosum]KAJ5135881.1 hypothetical protein N7515_005159 [Penicillium bovifimosum]